MDMHLFYSVIGSVCLVISGFALYYFLQCKLLKTEYAALLIEKKNYETISKKANDIILTVDITSGVIYDANIQAVKTLGYKPIDIRNKKIYDLHPPNLLELSARTIAEVWEKKGLIYQNLPFVTAEGELLEVECSAKVLIYDDKPVIIIYARDIRERLRMEREIQEKNEALEEKNADITAGITYASRIQNAVLSNFGEPDTLFPNAFIFLKPHSIVSGDFYWSRQVGQYKIAVAADCTGHGVPGAFMTLLGSNYLDQIVENDRMVMPDKILNELNHRVSVSLAADNAGESINDGMDMAVLTFDEHNHKVYYAGAKNPLLIVKNRQAKRIKASRFAVGGQPENKIFQLHEIDLEPQTTFYIYSDGFQDQFGGERNRKFMSTKFRNLLVEISDFDMSQQKSILDETFSRWKGNNYQTDDVLVVGIRI